MSEAKLLTAPTNYAVVQLPGRNFPGVVIQGDSLNNLVQLLSDTQNADEPEERTGCIAEAREILAGALKGYENVLTELNLALPYGHS